MQELGQVPSLEAWVMQYPRMAWAYLYFESSPEGLPEYLRPCSCAASDTPLMATGKCCPHVAGGAGPVE